MNFRHYIFLTAWLLCVNHPVFAANGGDRSVPVKIAIASMTNLSPVIWVSGTVISRNDAKLAAEVEGQVKMVAEVGKYIAADGVVAKIDNTFIKLKIEELKSAVEREKAQLHFLNEEVKRLQRLAKQNNAARTRLEQTQADKQIAKSDLSIARTRLALAREELARHLVRTPFGGVVAERLMQRGERANIGDAVVRLIDPNALEIQAQVPLTSINYISENSELRIRINIDDSQIIKGKVRTIVPVGDERSRLLDLRIDFDQALWRVGQPLRVALPTANPREVLAIPRDALVMRRDGTFVYRVNSENKAEKVSVDIGIADGKLVEIMGTLRINDKVITRGGERLRPGQLVKFPTPENPTAE